LRVFELLGIIAKTVKVVPAGGGVKFPQLELKFMIITLKFPIVLCLKNVGHVIPSN
jgi:hypothetical protein